MKKCRILFIVNGLAVGGGELKLLELVSELKKSYDDRYHIIVCSVGQGGPLESAFRDLGVKTVVFQKTGKYDITQIWKLIRLMKEEKIHIVHTTLFYADVLGALASAFSGIKSVVSWEAVTQPYGLKHLFAYRLASKYFALSVAVSHAIQRKVIDERQIPLHKTTTIQYGVDLKKFHTGVSTNLRKELGLGGKSIIVGTVARLTEQKGHRYLIPAIPSVIRAVPNAHFVFIGDGPLRKELETLVGQFKIKSSVTFLGYRSDVPALLNGMDIFMLPSLFEGLPNVVLEAMASGKPVIATAVDGTPEAVMDGETGLLVPPKDTEALSQALKFLLKKPDLIRKMGRAGRRRVETHFTLDHEVHQFVRLFGQLMQSGGYGYAG